MKKNILIFVLSLGVFTACDNELTNNPYNSLSSDVVFSTPKGFENALNGVYTGLIGNDRDALNDMYGDDLFMVPDVLADNLILNTNGRQTKTTLNNWLYNGNSYSGFDLYGDAYKVINRCNNILANINKLDNGNFKNDIKGQALAARALAHFDLVKTYGQIPTQSAGAGSSLGVAYITTVDPLQKPARNTVDEVYTNIIIDLEEAKNIIGTNGTFNINTVNALLSRVYLYMGNWPKVISSANAVTGAVASITDFPNVWIDESEAGIVSKLKIRIIDGIAIGTGYSQTNPTNGVRSEYNVALEFYNLFNNSDIRKQAYISTSPYSGITYNHVKKYFGKIGQVNNIVDAKLFRMAEVMLNKAEAYAELGQDAAALTALDAVRSQRYLGFSSGGETGTVLKSAIALERRLELAFEGHRFYDLKRKGLDIIRNATDGDAADGSGTPVVFTMLTAGDYRFQLPIPQNALNSNENLIQNPGY